MDQCMAFIPVITLELLEKQNIRTLSQLGWTEFACCKMRDGCRSGGSKFPHVLPDITSRVFRGFLLL